MSGKKKSYAVIDIGSNELRLRIAEKDEEYMKMIETLAYRISLGTDTFDTGKIGFDKLDKTCRVVQNFLTVLETYDVDFYRVVATTAVREAKNRDYVLDQIKVKTGLSLDVLDATDEKLYLFKLMFHLLEKKIKQSAMMVYIGSGSVGFGIVENEKITYTQNIKVGTLRVFRIFDKLKKTTEEFYKIIEEYMNSFTMPLLEAVPEKTEYFVASGHEVGLIANLTNSKKDGSFFHIEKQDFLNLFEAIKSKTVEQIEETYNIPEEQADILIPAMCIYRNLLNMTKATKILAPMIFISDSILFEAIYPEEMERLTKEFDKIAVNHAKIIAKKYLVSEEHYSVIEAFSVKMFDKMKKLHGMGKKEKILLRISAILHDIGKFINLTEHNLHSFQIISALDIAGLSRREVYLISNIALYHSDITPSMEDDNYSVLPTEDRVLISKLSAILRLAEALDKSHKNKITDIDTKIENDNFVLTIASLKNTQLEEWSLKEKGNFFEEVFGLKLKLRKRR